MAKKSSLKDMFNKAWSPQPHTATQAKQAAQAVAQAQANQGLGSAGGASQAQLGNQQMGQAGSWVTISGAGNVSNVNWFGQKQLTEQEQKDLNQFKEEHRAKLKIARLTEFKNLPKEFRQTIINIHDWSAVVTSMNGISLEKDPRFVELEQKANNNNLFGSNINITYGFDYKVQPPLPEDISLQELKDAHIEQTVEEEMLNA